MADYDLSNLNVLIVDDHQPMRLILKNVLHALGIKSVLEASGGEEALKKMRGAKLDIVFADNMMKPVSGIEMVEKIRAGEDGINPFTPIIMISGLSDRDQIIKARDAGINEFLAKPISAKMVYLRICSVIEHPRSFINAESFTGPDRRRREAMIDGQERRDGEYDYDAQKRTKERTAE